MSARPAVVFERRHLPLPRRRQRRRSSDVSFALEPGEFCLLAGLSGHGKSTAAARRLRARAALPRRALRRRASSSPASTRASTAPRGSGAFAGALFQDPETQLVMSSVRAELALALESRGHGAAAVARGVEEVALALGIDALLDRSTHDALGRRAAARRARRCARRAPARACCSTSRPRSWTPSRATSCSGCCGASTRSGRRRAARRAPPGALPGGRRPRDRAARAAPSPATATPARSWSGRRAPRRRCRPPARGCSRWPACGPPPVGVKQARATLRAQRAGLLAGARRRHGRTTAGVPAEPPPGGPGRRAFKPARKYPRRRRGAAPPRCTCAACGTSCRDGPAILRGVELRLQPGEAVALMGRNGAGKSTLLRHAAGLLEPTRGRIERAGRVALLLQNPGDYFLHERVARGGRRGRARAAWAWRTSPSATPATSPAASASASRSRSSPTAPRSPGVLALDEPTRGMDRLAKARAGREPARRVPRTARR